jgi:hypothetical protein
MTLYGDFLSFEHRRMHKWYQYFAAYEQHFERFRNRHITVFEIGIGEGGSLQQWRRYFGPFAIIVGIDINPRCKQVEEDQIHVRIGSQTDTGFLASLLAEFGNPDIVIDDGSHIQSDIITTFDVLYPSVAKNGVYLVEDLHAAYWPAEGGGLRRSGSFIERAKGFVDQMHAEYTWAEYAGGNLPRSALGDRTRSIHFHDGIVVLEVGEYRPKRNRLTGNVALFDTGWTAPEASGAASGGAAPELPASQAVLDQIVKLQDHIRRLEAGEPPPDVPLGASSPLRARIDELETSLAASRRAAAEQIDALEAQLAASRHAAAERIDGLAADLAAELAAARRMAAEQIDALRAQLAMMRASTSWRLTGPLRALGRLFR